MSDLKIHALNYLVGCFNKDHEIVTPEVVEEAQKELDAIRKEKGKRRRMSEEESVDQASAHHDSLLELRRVPLPPLDRGWYWFTFEYRTPSGGRFEVDMAAQSIEDAETRLRWIRETSEVAGQIVAEYEATNADVARARMLQRGTIPGTSMVCDACGCRWKVHRPHAADPEGSLQLYDANQKPCAKCDNGPNPPLRPEGPPCEHESVNLDTGVCPDCGVDIDMPASRAGEKNTGAGAPTKDHPPQANVRATATPAPTSPAPASAGWTDAQRIAASEVGHVVVAKVACGDHKDWSGVLCAAIARVAPHFHKVRVRLPERAGYDRNESDLSRVNLVKLGHDSCLDKVAAALRAQGVEVSE